ncbi:MAG: hypothetical protein QOH24_624 [Verrucomicrobiota bacterium]
MAPLTILAGANASGKSTIVQTLALLHQTTIEHEWSHALLLNGTSIALGTLDDVIDQEPTDPEFARRESFSICVGTNNGEALWTAGGLDQRDALSAPLMSIKYFPLNSAPPLSQPLRLSSDPIDAANLPVFRLFPRHWEDAFRGEIESIQESLRRLIYISSERLGPRETYEHAPDFIENLVGARGQFTASYLYRYGGDQSNAGLRVHDQGETIRDQTNAWMNYFFPGANVQVTPIEGVNLVKLSIRTRAAGNYHRPQNVGFGLTHLLPIIVACIGSRPTDTILIENPETHLHPAAQSQIGTFIAATAASGVQVILETHSDHVLNGIRKAVASTKLSPERLAIYYIDARPSRSDEALSDTDRIHRIPIDEQGRISNWPRGFFDQMENDLDEIFGD